METIPFHNLTVLSDTSQIISSPAVLQVLFSLNFFQGFNLIFPELHLTVEYCRVFENTLFDDVGFLGGFWDGIAIFI